MARVDALGSLEAIQSRLSVLSEETDSCFATNDWRFEIKALLGEGSFGSVYRCTLGRSAEFAVKIINARRISMLTGHPHDALVARLLQEAEVLRRVAGHPNIITLHSMCISRQSLRLFLVTELVPGGDLFGEVVRRRKPMLEDEARSVAEQLVSAVAHCHGLGVAHRDIKLENILVSSPSPLQVKLGDFGSAVVMQDAAVADLKTTAKTLTTTEHYTPPEVAQAMHDNASYDAFKVDAFDIGVVLYVIVCNAFPDVAKAQAFEAHPRFSNLSSDAQDFVCGMLRQDPQQRFEVVASQTHPFLEGRCSSKSSAAATSPVSLDAELQGLLAVQGLVKSLQRQRGASCWVAASSEGRMEYAWRCQCTVQRLELARARLADLAGEHWEHLRAAVERAAVESERWVRRIENAGVGEHLFEELFGGYCGPLQAVADAFGAAISEVLRPLRQGAPSCDEVRLKLLLLIGEQLGRERAFVSGHIDRPEMLRSLPVRLRFAKIQGARQMLLGSSASGAQYDVASSAGGLLPGLFLLEEPLLSDREIADLEEAELHVFEGKTGTSEWWSLLTQMIDTMHSRLSLGLIESVHRAVAAHQGADAAPPAPDFANGSLYERQTSDEGEACLQEGDTTDNDSDSTASVASPEPNLFPAYTPWSCVNASPKTTPLCFTDPLWASYSGQPWGLSVPNAPEPPVPACACAEVQSHVGSGGQTDFQYSVGSVGHPHACSGLGCKFASKRGGCKDGVACSRCHLCVWTRKAERRNTAGVN